MPFFSDTFVACVGGWKRIEKVKVGEYVVTHAGRSMPVTRTWASAYEGPIVYLMLTGPWERAVKATAHQRVLSSDGRWLPLSECDLGTEVASASDMATDGPLPFSEHPFPEQAAGSLAYASERGVAAVAWDAARLTRHYRDDGKGTIYNLAVEEDGSFVVGNLFAAGVR